MQFRTGGETRPVRARDNIAFQRIFAPGRLTLGVFFPIEAIERDQPTMRCQEHLARRAEEFGFAAVWFRDVPLRDPNFGDVGQVYDARVYLGWIAAHAQPIALATGPIHCAAATSASHRKSSRIGRSTFRRAFSASCRVR